MVHLLDHKKLLAVCIYRIHKLVTCRAQMVDAIYTLEGWDSQEVRHAAIMLDDEQFLVRLCATAMFSTYCLTSAN